MKTILVIGRNGQVSTYIQKVFADNAITDYALVAAGREEIDLSLIDRIRPALERLKPTIIINPAAFTAVDLAEEQVDSAFQLNRDAVQEIAQYCADTQTPLIHFSTDYVFNGESDTAYSEIDKPSPNGVYGESKLAGEQCVIASGAPAMILRTSWVYSNHGKNFYKTMLTLAETRDELSVVADQVGAPTYAGSIANATLALLKIVTEQGGITKKQSGIYHFSCEGQTSWAQFAEEIFSSHDKDVTVHAISTAEYPTPATRPAFSVLSGLKLKEFFDLELPDWRAALADCVAENDQLKQAQAEER